MDFFERQDRARRGTAVLVAVFLLAVIAIVLAVDAIAWAAFLYLDPETPGFLGWLQTRPAWIVTAVALTVVAGGSVHRWIQLAHGGGGRVAILMGGRIVDPATRDPRERVLINVVEEMAVASGVTLPDVYVLDHEPSINAFAAGLYPAQAVIVVTKGTSEELDRDQLQGVIAHEFSHILNGDMRLNLQLLALLAGITVIGQMGASVFRGAALGRRRSRVSSGRGGGSGVLIVFGIAAALVIVGWIGVLAGRVIKAAVSRQREFLADAAAVQFTRNPDGIAGALLKIRDNAATSLLQARHAEEVSHMAFGRAVGGLTRLTATHPPLEARMRALGPKYALWFRQDSRERARRRRAQAQPRATTPASASANRPSEGDWLHDTLTAGGAIPVETLAGDAWGGAEWALSPAALAVLAGSVSARDLDHARRLLDRLPATIRHALHTPEGATRVLYALLLHGPEWRDADADALPEGLREAVLEARTTLEQRCPGEVPGTLDPRLRLPLLELAIPALRRLPRAAIDEFLLRVDGLVRADERVSLFEFTARSVLRHELSGRAPRSGNERLEARRADARLVLSLLAMVGGGGDAEARAAAYTRAARPLLGENAGEPLPPAECTPAAFTAALERLDALRPTAKRALLLACADCIASDGLVRPAEAELWRAIAVTLDVPVPPLGMH
ncbi:MAG: M48 family metalloprotease [Halofilum sp. (in: g-proteobacteria)]|nr:M48 family metalloprotease [Halofilum sp. (in: g-proteobacteria)]